MSPNPLPACRPTIHVIDGRLVMADPSCRDTTSLDGILDSVTNSVVQDVAKSLDRQGCKGGLGDARALRAAVRQIVSANVQRMRGPNPDLTVCASPRPGAAP